jgi:hypothetical protein
MPRPRKDAPGPQLSSGQAAYVLERLIADRRVTRTDVSQYVSEMSREITALEERLKRLREASGGVIAAATAGVAAVAAVVRRRRRRRTGRPPGRPPGRPGRPPGRPPGSSSKAAAAGGKKRGRKRSAAITAEQLASRQLQGRYLALVRQFPATRRAQFAKVAKEKGREAAIKEMQNSLSK